MKKQYIIPIFVPHLGCPNDCIFCNQRSISGQQKMMTGEDVSVPTKTQPQPNVSGLTAKLEQAAALPKAAQLSGGKTSQMSWSEVERLAREEKWDEIPKEMLLKLDPTGSLL